MTKQINSPSEITEFFYNSLMEIMPPDLQEDLKSHSKAVIELSPENDGERAWLCRNRR